VTDGVRETLVARRAGEAAAVAAESALERLLAGDAASDVAGEHSLTWNTHEATGYVDGEIPVSVRQAAFRLSPPVGEERSATTTPLMNGSSALVVISRVDPGDYGAMSEAERDNLRGDLAQLASQRALVSVLGTLREEADL